MYLKGIHVTRRLVAAPAAVPAATAGIVGKFATASVELARMAGATVEVSAPTAERSPVASPAAVEVAAADTAAAAAANVVEAPSRGLGSSAPSQWPSG
jgi:hypothetical protein